MNPDPPNESSSSTSSKSNNSSSSESNKSSSTSSFSCHICLDPAEQPVVTRCGHLFCWPCIHEWLLRSQACPVCKAEISKENLIPLYGSGQASEEDPRSTVPPRPAGEPQPQARGPSNWGANPFFPMFGGGGGGGGVSIGLFGGFLPFFSIGTSFQRGQQPMTREEAQRQQIVNAFIGFAIMLLMSFVFNL